MGHPLFSGGLNGKMNELNGELSGKPCLTEGMRVNNMARTWNSLMCRKKSVRRGLPDLHCIYKYIYVYIYICVCGLCSKFIYFLANQKNTFANLWRTPRLSFAGVSCLNVSLNLSPKNNVLPRTQKKTLAVSHVETRRPWQLKTLTWTFRTTSIYTARHMHIPTSSTYVKFCPFRFRQSDKFSLDC